MIMSWTLPWSQAQHVTVIATFVMSRLNVITTWTDTWKMTNVPPSVQQDPDQSLRKLYTNLILHNVFLLSLCLHVDNIALFNPKLILSFSLFWQTKQLQKLILNHETQFYWVGMMFNFNCCKVGHHLVVNFNHEEEEKQWTQTCLSL